MEFISQLFNQIMEGQRLLVVILLAVGAHLVAIMARKLLLQFSLMLGKSRVPKLQTIIHLLSGVFIFSVYFYAFGLVLLEFGVSLTAYLATASVIGLAVGFGSQNIVQDVISGLTVILSDLIEIGDMVEIAGQTGIVRSVGMRFTVLQNSMGAVVYIPNRTLTSLISYPRGYIRCLVDVELTGDADTDAAIESVISAVTENLVEQFPSVMRAPFQLEGRRTTSTGKTFYRIKFRIWPGRGSLIETSYRQELLARIRRLPADFTDGMVSVSYEVDQTGVIRT